MIELLVHLQAVLTGGDYLRSPSGRRVLDISNSRYKACVEQSHHVIVAQYVQLSLNPKVVQLTGQKLAACVSLITTMGAGWQPNTAVSVRAAR